jgi:hypothetical protein
MDVGRCSGHGHGHTSLDISVATLPGTDVHRLGGSNLGLLHRSQLQSNWSNSNICEL